MTNLTECPHCGVAVTPQDDICQSCFCDLSKPRGPDQTIPNQDARPHGDWMENDHSEPPRHSTVSQRKQPFRDHHFGEDELPSAERIDVPEQESTSDGAIRFRPRIRPPMAVVKVFDDDLRDGEMFRIRNSEITIGREEGDIVISHERMMSSTHAKISRRLVENSYRWFITDLDSTNGTFLKVRTATLEPNSVIMLGHFRYRFDAAAQGSMAETDDPVDTSRTMGWKKVSTESVYTQKPKLIRITPTGEEDEMELPSEDCWVGSDSSNCDIVIDDDEMVSGRHVHIWKDDYNRWQMEDAGSRNGSWISVKDQRIPMSGQFLLGEQKFSIRFP